MRRSGVVSEVRGAKKRLKVCPGGSVRRGRRGNKRGPEMEIRAAVGEGRSIYTLTLLYYVLYVFILYSSTLPATLSMKAEGGRSAQRRTTAPFTASAPSLWGCGEGTILGHAAQACWGRSILLVPLVPTRTSSALLVPTEIKVVLQRTCEERRPRPMWKCRKSLAALRWPLAAHTTRLTVPLA